MAALSVIILGISMVFHHHQASVFTGEGGYLLYFSLFESLHLSNNL